jgi:choline kinase
MKNAPALVVLAAGIGSRYGGLKQMDPVGPSGEFIIDYSIHDAIRAGFGSVVFVIRKDIEDAFRSTISGRVEARTDVRYVFQSLDSLPAGHMAPEGRVKPWGTGHAVLCARNKVNGPFAAINADDFYGHAAYAVLGRFLVETAADQSAHAMVGYRLRETVTPNGLLARAICRTDENGWLRTIDEVTDIRQEGEGVVAPGRSLTGLEVVSMNIWGFKQSIFEHLDAGFREFLGSGHLKPKAEFYLPSAVQRAMDRGGHRVKVFPPEGNWMGMTDRKDHELVVSRILELVAAGIYPRRLWS